MTAVLKRLAVALILLLSAGPIWAVNPDEVLSDPALEARAREISRGLRCVVCRGETIDESNAGIARDMRLLVRERLLKGDSNEQVMNYLVDRYGEYVLMKPTTRGANVLLWISGPLLFAIAAGGALMWLRGRARRAAEGGEATLSEAEKARLARLLGEDGAGGEAGAG